MMEHADIAPLLPAYVDQELDLRAALEVERHLATCEACRRDVAGQRRAGARVRGGAYASAAPALRARVLAALPAAGTPAPAPRPRWWHVWPELAGAVAAVLALAWGASVPPSLTDELVASHIRALQVDHLADVVSTDQHTVKPWFNGKLDFAPPVVDLAAQGFPLVGGRLDYLGGRTVAVLVYRRARHPINLTIWPHPGPATMSATVQQQGFYVVRWRAGGMDYAAVSDVAAPDLVRFVALLRP